jgi:hypothetical protein
MKVRKIPKTAEATQITKDWFDNPHPNPLHRKGWVVDPVHRMVVVKDSRSFQNVPVGNWVVEIPNEETAVYSDEDFHNTWEEIGVECHRCKILFNASETRYCCGEHWCFSCLSIHQENVDTDSQCFSE